jgi:hypothetical protein
MTHRIILRFFIALAVSATLGLPISAQQTPTTVTGAYVIVASNETAQNTSDGEPLQITFDLIQTRSGVTVANILSNSNCINADTIQQQLINPSVKLGPDSTILSFTFGSAVDSSIYTFSTTENRDGGYIGTLSATGGCASGDTGNFTAQIIAAPSRFLVYSGTLTADSGTGNEPAGYTGSPANIVFRINAKFLMDGTALKISAPMCGGAPARQTLTVTPRADSIGGFQSIQSGNVLLFNAIDSTGANTVTFIATPTGADGNTNAPGQWNLSYYVETGACAGFQGTGLTFSTGPNPPIRAVEPIHPHFNGNPGLAR